MKQRSIIIQKGQAVPFHNNVDFCVGTGRMGLALQQEYQDQLKLVQEEIGFRYIRGHGLFCDDMAIYHEYEENGETKVEYNYTYLDMVMDSYRKVGLKPFLELGFMPGKLASGTQTIFYWKGNTTPPKDYDKWCDMVQALLRHLMIRYGREEVLTWPIEVWNEPNLPGFWEKADMEEYFKLFKRSFLAIKEVDPALRVGGPAICGVMDELWISKFMDFCRAEKLAVDFVTRHHYTSEFPKHQGHYGYIKLMDPEAGFANLQTTRDIIDSYPEYKGLEIHITEFNTSYIPNAPIHDTNENAAFLAHQLSRLGDVNESYSYWTFGDIFEEQGVPYTPFHGGFGLVANGCIPKPTFWTFAFYKELQKAGSKCVHRDENSVVMEKPDGSYHGVLWNHRMCGLATATQTNQNGAETAATQTSGGPSAKEETTQTGGPIELTLSLPLQAEASLLYKVVDEETCNPLKLWHDMGEPANLTEEQKKLLRMGAMPAVKSGRVEAATAKTGQTSGTATDTAPQMQGTDTHPGITFTLQENAVIYFTVAENRITSDRGYDYERARVSETI